MKLTRIPLLVLLCTLVACGKPYQATVYGRSGKLYQAPQLCAALVACKNAEPECYYETVRDGAGSEWSCRESSDTKK